MVEVHTPTHARFFTPHLTPFQGVYHLLGERAYEAELCLHALSEQCLAAQSPIPIE